MLFVFGAGGHGKVVADAARTAGYALAGFVDDSPTRAGTSIWDLPVLSWQRLANERRRWPEAVLAMGVGANGARERCQARIEAAGFEVVAVAHARATIAPSATIGAGTVLMAGSVVSPDATLGRGCIVNTGAVVEHDCRRGHFVHGSPNAALGGAVSVGDRTHLGMGAVALPGITIGAGVRVGAGAVVHRNVMDGLTVVGVPARPLESKGNS
jgi:sugar O-acyltransferase (sialic acid O-acetyltransferase NeuD family)